MYIFNYYKYSSVCVCVRVCVRACVRVIVHLLHVQMYLCDHACLKWDNMQRTQLDIGSRLN